MNRIVILFVFFVFLPTWGQQYEMSDLTVRDRKEEGPLVQDSTFKSEKVNQKKIADPTRQSLADLVRDQVGVDAQTYCANCGAKRLTINGLKGEHTSILVDGIPLHSAVSSFYGVDTVPLLGIQEVQVMRGAGASLTNPEAIGGTLNIVTVDPLESKSRYSTSVGIDDRLHGKSQNHSAILQIADESKRNGVVVGGQFSRSETWDVDRNNLSESPQRQNSSLLVKSRSLVSKKHDISTRISFAQLEILGGFWRPTKPSEVRDTPAGQSDFDSTDGDVDSDYIGDPATVTDWILLERFETGVTGTYLANEKLSAEWKAGYARQEQKAIYQHGFDYANIDNLFVGDFHFHYSLNPNNILKVGHFYKDQKLRSASQQLFEEEELAEDGFNFTSTAAYLQWTHFASDSVELDFALRADHIDVDWVDSQLDNRVAETVLAPRFQYMHNFTEHLTQRISYGLGYRAPLTFFESQHGNDENGYEIDISELEKAHSLVYSLSHNTSSGYITGGMHYTHLMNMAFGFEELGQPIQYRNDTEDYDIYVFDLLTGYKPSGNWLVEVSYENFQYPAGYKRNLPTAAIEDRVQLRSTYDSSKWTGIAQVTVVGQRDLSKYGGYNDHYKTRDNELGESFGDPGYKPKNQEAPLFATVDASLTYKASRSFNLSLGVNNLFNYTQAGAGDSPATWHWHFDHAHYDGLHTWGPNTGRLLYLQLNGEI